MPPAPPSSNHINLKLYSHLAALSRMEDMAAGASTEQVADSKPDQSAAELAKREQLHDTFSAYLNKCGFPSTMEDYRQVSDRFTN